MASKQEQKVIAAALAGGDGAHIARLAESYYYGRGRDKNLKTALKLWERAAELGNAEAPVSYTHLRAHETHNIEYSVFCV